MSMQTVGILQIKEEISIDENVITYLNKEVLSLEFTVKKVSIIRNDERLIADELNSMIINCDIIIVVSDEFGMILRTVGKIISQELTQCKELIEFYQEKGIPFSDTDISLPIQAKVIKNNIYPIIYFQRIFMFKDNYLKQCFNKVFKEILVQYRKPKVFQKTIQISKNGNSIDDLNELKKLIVTIDFIENKQFYVFKVKAQDLAHFIEIQETIKRKFKSHFVNAIDDSEIWEKVYSSQEKHIRHAIENIERCLEQYKPENTFLSFNGGKDCTVLLHLVLTVIRKKFPNFIQPIFCLYVQSEKPFSEQDEFINLVKSYYNLKVFTIQSGIKNALQRTLEKFPQYKACFMGTRRTDPYSNDLNVFQMTDSNWPQIMRVSPLLDWHYSDIWDYLLYYKVPYCKLYDLGYTSLGNAVNTSRNPSLVYFNHLKNKEEYLPAYKLIKECKERNGRDT